MELKYKKEIELLKQGHDFALRETIATEIEYVLQKSASGEIGWGDFIAEIDYKLNTMKILCEKYWKNK